MFIAQGASHPGNVRQVNEDAWRMDQDMGLFIVADGMGGHNAGEIASEVATDAIVEFLRRTNAGEDVTWPYGIDPELSQTANRLMTAVRLGNRRVFRTAESRDEYSGMGTTVVAILIEADRLCVASVGDSRLYLLRDGRLEQITKDDSWISTLRAEDVAVAPGTKHPMRHVLTNVVGAREQVDFPVTERELADGDLLLLCSDGLHGELDDDRMASIMTTASEPAAIADRLVQATLAGRAPDNVTAVVIRYARG